MSYEKYKVETQKKITKLLGEYDDLEAKFKKLLDEIEDEAVKDAFNVLLDLVLLKIHTVNLALLIVDADLKEMFSSKE